jgi:hypothetical protein
VRRSRAGTPTPDTRATTVVTQLDVIGSEVPDQVFRVKRVIAADDLDDLDSPLSYDVETETVSDDTDDMPPARRKLLDALHAASGPRTASQLVDWIALEAR